VLQEPPRMDQSRRSSCPRRSKAVLEGQRQPLPSPRWRFFIAAGAVVSALPPLDRNRCGLRRSFVSNLRLGLEPYGFFSPLLSTDERLRFRANFPERVGAEFVESGSPKRRRGVVLPSFDHPGAWLAALRFDRLLHGNLIREGLSKSIPSKGTSSVL
jgi:hypothetical protein